MRPLDNASANLQRKVSKSTNQLLSRYGEKTFGWCDVVSSEPRCDVSTLHCPPPFPRFLQPFVSHSRLVILYASASGFCCTLFKPCAIKLPLCLAALHLESLAWYPPRFVSLSLYLGVITRPPLRLVISQPPVFFLVAVPRLFCDDHISLCLDRRLDVYMFGCQRLLVGRRYWSIMFLLSLSRRL